MAKSNAQRRMELFNRFSANLGIHVPGCTGLFACPLCLRVFGPEALTSIGESPLLSIEHIPPGAAGGRLKTLTCSKCNSQGGTTIDAHLTSRFRYEDALAGVSGEPIRAFVRPEGGDKALAGNWYVHSGEDGEPALVFSGTPRASHPDAPEEVMHALSAGQPLHVSLVGRFSALGSRISLLRAAYLMMFQYFGYGYLRYGAVEVVREQIQRPEIDLISASAILSFDEPPFLGEMNRPYAIYAPVELRCFLVAIEVKAARDRYFGVIMPGLDSESHEVYDRFAASREALRGQRVSPLQVPYDPRALADPDQANYAMAVWTEVIRQGFGITDDKSPLAANIPQPLQARLLYVTNSGGAP